MPSGFQYSGEEFDRVFITESAIIERFVGNRLWVWGYNNYGQLGDGTTTDRSSPVTTAGGGTNWSTLVSSGSRFIDFNSNEIGMMAGIKNDGTLWTWGANYWGNLGDGTAFNSKTSPATTAGGGTNWKQVAIGAGSGAFDAHTAAVKTDGTLWTWGRNDKGQLGASSTSDRSSPGTMAGGGTNWVQVTCGNQFTAAVKADGTLWTWGNNGNGELGDGTGNLRSSPGTTAGGGTNWRSVSSAYLLTAAIKTDGTLWTWGNNLFGSLGNGNTTARSSPGTTAGGGTNWKQVAVAFGAMAAIKSDGTLWTWGYNGFGQLGTSGISERSSPGTTAGGGTNWKQANIGGYIYGSGAGIKTDGTLWTWGDNTKGQLGTGNTTARTSPGTTISNATTWKSVTMVSGACIALSEA